MAKFFRTGNEWHAFRTQCSSKMPDRGKVDEVTDDVNHVYKSLDADDMSACVDCHADICFAYMIDGADVEVMA